MYNGELPKSGSNNWNEWARYVLESIKANNKNTKDLEDKINQLITSVEIIKVKMQSRAALIGALSGFLPAAAVAVYLLIRLSNG